MQPGERDRERTEEPMEVRGWLLIALVVLVSTLWLEPTKGRGRVRANL